MGSSVVHFPGRLVLALSLSMAAAVAAAASLPRVIHGTAPTVLVDVPIVVSEPLLQIELTPGIYVSAAAGAVLVLTPARESGDAFALTLLAGPAMALNTQREEMRPLGVGTHLIGRNIAPGDTVRSGTKAEAWTAPIESLPGYASLSNEQRQGLLIGDGLMVRQQQYLDKLKVDVTAINRVVVSIIRSMLPH